MRGAGVAWHGSGETRGSATAAAVVDAEMVDVFKNGIEGGSTARDHGLTSDCNKEENTMVL